MWPPELRRSWIGRRLLLALLLGFFGAVLLYTYVDDVGWPPATIAHALALVAVVLSLAVFLLIDIAESWPKPVTFWVVDRRQFLREVGAALAVVDYVARDESGDLVIFRHDKSHELSPVIICAFAFGQATVTASREQWGLFVWRLPDALREPVLAAIPAWPVEHTDRFKLGLALAIYPLVELLANFWHESLGIVPGTLVVPLSLLALAALAVLVSIHWMVPRLRLRGARGWRGHVPQIATFALLGVTLGMAYFALKLCFPCTVAQWSEVLPAMVVAPADPGAPGSQLQFEQLRTGLGCGGERWLVGVIRNTGSVPLADIAVSAQWPDGLAARAWRIAWLRPGEYALLEAVHDDFESSHRPNWTRAAITAGARALSPEELAALDTRPAAYLRIVDSSAACGTTGVDSTCSLSGHVRNEGNEPVDIDTVSGPLVPIPYDARGYVTCLRRQYGLASRVEPGAEQEFTFYWSDCAGPVARYEIQIR